MIKIRFYLLIILVYETFLACSPRLATTYYCKDYTYNSFDTLYINSTEGTYNLVFNADDKIRRRGHYSRERNMINLHPDLLFEYYSDNQFDSCVSLRFVSAENQEIINNYYLEINDVIHWTDSLGVMELCGMTSDSVKLKIRSPLVLGYSNLILHNGHDYTIIVDLRAHWNDSEHSIYKVTNKGLKYKRDLVWRIAEY